MSGSPLPRRARIGWWGRILLLVALLVIGLAGIALYTEFRMEDVGSLSALGEGEGVFLIVGSDSRANLPPDLGSFGDFPGARADVIMLAQVAGDRRQLLSIPRDLKVEVPGEGTEKINAAYSFGGANLITETVALTTGIRPNHYLEIDFAGFAAIVDALGGIELDFPFPARDLNSGLLVEVAGNHTVNGAAALAYARSRQYEELRDGEWRAESVAGDLARTGRQRHVLLQIMRKASSPIGLLRSPLVMLAAASHLKSDAGTTVFDLARLGWGMVTSSETDSATLPVQISNEGGVSYVVAVPPSDEVLTAFRNRQPLPS
ncbi:MAG TPA: LCP family protein [Acidimicrobiia bacterium]|nr:LCP family protein [Acidimicrobiia bacterium]